MTLSKRAPTDLPAAYSGVDARRIMARHASSFTWASKWLPQRVRADIEALYAFARTADDLADEASLGPQAQRIATLDHLHAALRAPPHTEVAGSTPPRQQTQVEGSDAVWLESLRLSLQRHRISAALVNEFVQAIKADAGSRQIQNQQELLDFCYGVAGTVGLMLRPVLGAAAHAERGALSLGIAMQLTNIARDVREDAERGRCYLPATWDVNVQRALSPQAMDQTHIYAAVCRAVELAEPLYSLALRSVDQLAPDCQKAVTVALVLYREIGRKIVRRGAHAYADERTRVSVGRKLLLCSALLLRRSSPTASRVAATADRAEDLLLQSPAAARWLGTATQTR